MDVVDVVLFLLAANGAPIVAGKLLGRRFGGPLDGGMRLWDGQPLFGSSKTLRGIVAAVAAAGAVALGLGYPVGLGLSFGALAMAGDLLSSFVKRRLGLAPSSRAVGLDQIPESLLPTLALASRIGLTLQDIILSVVFFIVLELGLSRILFKLRIRKVPY